MSVNVATSRIFLVSIDSAFSQRLATFFSAKFELFIFENWKSAFQNIHHRPLAIFLEIENDLASVMFFLEKMLDFDQNIPIILIQKNNNTTDINFLAKSNIYDCFQKEELTQQRLDFLLKNITRSNQLQSQLENMALENSSVPVGFLEKEMTFEAYKSKIIHHFLEKYDNDILVVSTKLDIGKSTIYRMLKSEKEKSSKKMSWFNLF